MDLTTPSDALLNRWRGRSEPLPDGTDWTVSGLTADGVEVGLAAFGHGDTTAVLATLWIDPHHRHLGNGRRGLRAVAEHCRGLGSRQLLTSTTPEPAQQRLFADWEVTSRLLEQPVGEPPSLPEGVTVTAMTEADFATWREHSVSEYATDLARATGVSDTEALLRAQRQFAQLLPRGVDTPDHELWTLNHTGNRVAFLWVHIDRARGFAFVYSVKADPAHRGRGYGRAATRLAETRALAAGLNRVRLHVFADNAPANGLYDALGYRTVRENRRKRL